MLLRLLIDQSLMIKDTELGSHLLEQLARQIYSDVWPNFEMR